MHRSQEWFTRRASAAVRIVVENDSESLHISVILIYL